VVSGANYVLKSETASTAVVYIKQTEHTFFGGQYRREILNYEMGHKYGPLQ